MSQKQIQTKGELFCAVAREDKVGTWNVKGWAMDEDNQQTMKLEENTGMLDLYVNGDFQWSKEHG